jgi:alpha-glucosidase
MSIAAEPLTATALAEPHHDGSDAYVLERPEELGGDAVVRVRIPRGREVDAVTLRYVRDGEARLVTAELDEETETDTWWRATFPVVNPAVRYRWIVGDAWLNGTGLVPHEVSDADDFVLAPQAGGPDWHLASCVYQIYPDRFASSGLDVEAPEWAIPREWDALPTGLGRTSSREWYGGDLRGIEQHLDHVERLGANAIYLTPIFPATSTHRYDATTFDRVDPLLGGDEAFASLLSASHARGMRVLGDLTLNHCGVGHDWFRAARDDVKAPERDFFWFDDELPIGYEAWLGVPELPKLDHRSPELRRRLYEGEDSVLRRWLRFGVDGWRIDVANMTGRHRDVDLNAEVARAVRRAAEETREDALIVAEHFHDFRPDLQGDGWHGVMNYAGFLLPVWTWLESAPRAVFGVDFKLPERTGREAVAAMRTYRSGVPWQSVLHSWALLDSHDLARFRSVAGSRERQLVGIGLQMTTPGVPMVFAGDELGLEGEWGEDGRRTMPWDAPERWDNALFDAYRELIALRRSSEALARGGLRYAHVGEDAIAYLRESAGERLLVLAARAAHAPVRLPLAALGARALETLVGGEASSKNGVAELPGDGPAFHVWRLT